MSVEGLGRVVIVIPTYNEALNIRGMVARLHQAEPGVDALIVDDNSPDGTGAIADELAAADDRIRVVHRTEKAGLGAAYLHGFAEALTAGYDVIGEMDCDGSHQPEQLGRLLAAAQYADLVIGCRWIPGGAVVDWPRSRQFLSRAGNLYARVLLGSGLHDATAGYRVFRRTALEAIGLDQVDSTGYVFQIDLAYRALRAGLTVVEVPITFAEREEGESKLDGSVATESLAKVTRWGVAQRTRQVRELMARARRTTSR